MAKKRRRSGGAAAATTPRGPRRWASAPGQLAVFGLVALFFVHAYRFSFTMDDAYISLRYAKNLVDGLGLVYNPGEFVEGYSNFSWTMLLAFFLHDCEFAEIIERSLDVLFDGLGIVVDEDDHRAAETRMGQPRRHIARQR